MEPTLKQSGKILELIAQSGRSAEWVQEHLIGSGVFTDLLAVDDLKGIHRESHRRFLGLPSFTPPFLKPLGTVTIQATERFIVREKFVVDTGKKVVKIAWLGDNFKSWFHGKIEEPAAASFLLRYAKITRLALDDEIRKEIGAEFEETTLAAIYELMERQKNGESGVLLTNGWANIFYVRDATGSLRAVFVCWHGDGWDVDADSVSHPSRWHDGYRVFSRNS